MLEKKQGQWIKGGSYRFIKPDGDQFTIFNIVYRKPYLYLSSRWEEDIIRINADNLLRQTGLIEPTGHNDQITHPHPGPTLPAGPRPTRHPCKESPKGEATKTANIHTITPRSTHGTRTRL